MGQKEKPLRVRMLLLPLQLLSYLYGGAVRLRVLFYSLGLLSPGHLPCPVISVGNLSAGGTGKTPLVMELAKRLMDKGVPVAVLSRGYKREKSSGSLVSDGRNVLLLPGESGDEPFLMGKTLKGVPVLVGKDRFVTGQLALQRFNVRGLLLDDGYQYLRLYRDVNILLVDSSVGFGDHHLLPRGILREPLTHLRRANLFILTKVRRLDECGPLEAILRKIHPSSPIFHSHYEAVGLVCPNGKREEIRSLEGMKVLAFSGISNPEYFSSLLREKGAEIVREMLFPDHHHYTAEDLASIQEESQGMHRVVTTEKDMLKFECLKIGHLPLRALRIEMRIWEEEEFYKRLTNIFLHKGEEDR